MMIHLLHAAFVYQAPDGEVEALRDVSLDVEEGEFCSIVGPSGCGKSTLLSALAGLEPLTGGEIAVDGETVRGPSPRVGFMPQQDQLFPWRSIWDNVTLGLAVRGRTRRRTGSGSGVCWTGTAWRPLGISGPGSCPAACASGAP